MSTPHHTPEVELPKDDEVFEIDAESVIDEVSGGMSTNFKSGPNTVPQGGN